MIYSVKLNGLAVVYYGTLMNAFIHVADVDSVMSVKNYSIVDNKGNIFFTGAF